jgi:subtilisin family serine protease
MTTISHSKARFGAALIVAIAALAIAAPLAGASLNSPPRSSGRQMHWYRWHPSTRALQARGAKFGSTAVLGLESMSDLASLRDNYDFERVRAMPALHAAQVSIDRAQLLALLAQAPNDPRLRYVSPVGPKRRAMSMPNDPFLSMIDGRANLLSEWQFAASHVDRALDLSHGNPGIVVGVIDTGVSDIPDLAGKVDSLWTVTGNEITQAPPEGNDDYGHGTAVASLIAANVDDAFGMAGFGGATHVIGVHAGSQGVFTDIQIALALAKLDSLGVRIVNMSLGGQTPSEPILVDAIHKVAADGILMVASAGNFHTDVSWPAADLQPSGGGRSYGLAVGATNVDGRLADFSNYGKHLSLVAPGDTGGPCSGVLVALPPANLFNDMCFLTWSSDSGARYGNISGTSFSSPEVAGIAALVWAARPELKNYQVADIIKQSARRDTSGWTPTMGCGILDAGAALELAMSRSAAAWAQTENDGAVCSAAGATPPAWPSEINQTITFDPLPNKTFGDPEFEVGATASSRLPVSFLATGTCTIRGATVHLTGAGSCTITASQDGDANYNLAINVSQRFVIAKAPRLSVHALAAAGAWNAKVRLPFRVATERRDVAVKMTVEKDGIGVTRLAAVISRLAAGQSYALTWRAPARTKSAFRFCVTLADRVTNQSARACGPIRLR